MRVTEKREERVVCSGDDSAQQLPKRRIPKTFSKGKHSGSSAVNLKSRNFTYVNSCFKSIWRSPLCNTCPLIFALLFATLLFFVD